MKKALLLVSILFISVISTACINNLAVQELNMKAKSYMDKGQYQEAIERLKASADLDDSLFETHYNLAVAYTQAEDYLNAVKSYEKAISINPDFADSYYSMAVAINNLAVDLKDCTVLIDENGELYKAEEIDDECKPDKDVLSKIDALKEESVQYFETYLEKNPNSADADEVREQIKKLQGETDDNTVTE